MHANPWLSGAPSEPTAAQVGVPPRRLRPTTPLRSGLARSDSDGLPTRRVAAHVPAPRWWWVGCHGGAGVSTLDAALAGGADAGGAWPADAGPTRHRVVLVARTHLHGLRAAQSAVLQWASGAAPNRVVLLGLAVVADAPGKLPPRLLDFLTLVSGGVPRVWTVPWMESVRLGHGPPPHETCPPLANMAADLSRVVPDTDSGGRP
ncbi:hypothetical protein LO772_32140 [Yinghuangia sp. ASG 101]|uniref:DUF6668 family protein n=1 Tax=Yinghuangia sp. ASG 101 TaxID=2896848 RepID=UPI001E6389FB|nr:DUF6668 family protein [Yinghuangia sp. ASG 101]UGQ11393.1 hypothetical protein LO772_32140 [Yinghuangia sp. ASG 101]